MSAPDSKKPRLEEDSLASVAQTTWAHYRSFLDSIDSDDPNGDDVGDIDDLMELLDLLEPYLKKKAHKKHSVLHANNVGSNRVATASSGQCRALSPGGSPDR